MPIIEMALRFRYVKNLWNSIIDYLSQIKGLFMTFNLIDLVDILFVAVMLYIVIRIIRETRAIQLVKGLLFLALLFFLVNFLGMSASSYILRSVFSNILIIVVILFGPEIRNILEQMGKGAARSTLVQLITSGSTALEITETKNAIDAVCKACTDMSDNMTGALIVFENETMLGDIVSSGTPLNARPTKELIMNVFFPKAPMHDGAMIIRDAKVAAAGCILPISRDNNISSELGTRHRAAIGLSQQSDAVVIVVSEETGYISVAQGGSLNRDISSGELRSILESVLIDEEASGGNGVFKKFIRRVKK